MFNYIYMSGTVQDIITTLETNLKSYDQNMNGFYDRALDKIQRIKDLIRQIQGIVASYNDTQHELQLCRENEAIYAQQIEQLQKQIEDLRRINDELRRNADVNEETMNRLNELRDEHDKLKEEYIKLQRELGETKTERDGERQQKEQLEKQIEEKEREINQQKAVLEQNEMEINLLDARVKELQDMLDGESSREKELKEQLDAYNEKLTALNTILSDMMTNDKSGQVEKGLQEIIDLLGGIPGVDSGSSSGTGGPGGPGGPGRPGGFIPPVLSPNPPVAPVVEQRSSSSSAPALSTTQERLGDNINQGNPLPEINPTVDAIPDVSEPVLTPQVTPRVETTTQNPIHQGSKNTHKARFNNKEVEFDIKGTPTDISARNAKIGKLIEQHFDNEHVYKEKGRINNYTTIVGKAVDILDAKKWRSNRTKVRNDLQKWQDQYTSTTGNKPFDGLYQDTTNYGVKESNIPDPFNIEFPMHGSKYFAPSTFGTGHDNKPKRKGGKKTRRKQGGKSNNKTIRYKRRKNKKNSKN